MNSDGSINFEVGVQTLSTANPTPIQDTLTLYQVQPSGAVTTQPLNSFQITVPNLSGFCVGLYRSIPARVIPDGQTGFLALWSQPLTSTCASPPPRTVTVSHVSNSGTSSFNLPLNSATLVPDQAMVLGENGTAFATDGTTVLSLDTNSNQPTWSYTSQAVNGISIVAETSGGTVATEEFDQNYTATITQLDSTGNPSHLATAPTSTPVLPSLSWYGNWYALWSPTTALSRVLLPMATDPDVPWTEPAGGPSETGLAGAPCDCVIETSNADPSPPPATCPICNLPAPVAPATSCTTLAGTQSNYVILVGDPGLIGHNVVNLFNLSAQTQANSLQTQGHNVIACRVSSVQDVYYALTKNGSIDGGVYYFGHSGVRTITQSGQPISQTSELFVGEGVGTDTNITSKNVIYLKPIQQDNGGNNFLGPNAAVWINGCYAALTIYDTLYPGYVSIAQLISANLNRGVYAYDVGMYFSQVDIQHDKYITGAGRTIPNTLPVHMIPEGAPGHKPSPLACVPAGGYCSKQ